MELLLRGAQELGLVLRPAHVAAFATYLHELLDWNRRFNLTAVTDAEEVQRRHFLDSLTCLLALAPRGSDGALLYEEIAGRAIDVGAGAGFPGVPLKILCPSLHLTLLDSVRKKSTFLEHLCRVLGLHGVEIVTARAEDLARRPGYRDSYDFALARALAPLPILLEYCLPFLRPGGLLVAPKKGELGAEIAAARPALAALNGRWREPLPVASSFLPDNRVLILVDKAAPTPKAYPRRAGIPAKNPLGS